MAPLCLTYRPINEQHSTQPSPISRPVNRPAGMRYILVCGGRIESLDRNFVFRVSPHDFTTYHAFCCLITLIYSHKCRLWFCDLAMSGLATKCRKPFPCPVFQADILLGRRHSCRGTLENNMSEVRRHLRRSRHVDFLRLCPTCNEDFTDREEFESKHGNNGEFCNNPLKQRRGVLAEEQWEALYRKINRMEPPPLAEG